jgi:hypothetical protein
MSTRGWPGAVGLTLALVLSSAALPGIVRADSWHCAHRLIGSGQTIDEVYERCGEPVDRSFATEYVTVRVAYDVAVTRVVPVERWLYNPGPRQFLRYLTFRDGILVAIDEGSYGY